MWPKLIHQIGPRTELQNFTLTDGETVEVEMMELEAGHSHSG
jgi:hypothetical protein